MIQKKIFLFDASYSITKKLSLEMDIKSQYKPSKISGLNSNSPSDNFHYLDTAANISTANKIIEKKTASNYDIFLINPNGDPSGLSEDKKAKSSDGLLTGCLWIDEIVEKYGKEEFTGKVFVFNPFSSYLKITNKISNWVKSKDSDIYTFVNAGKGKELRKGIGLLV